MDVMQKRMGQRMPLRFDLIGISSILGDDQGRMLSAMPTTLATDVRLRVAGPVRRARLGQRIGGLH